MDGCDFFPCCLEEVISGVPQAAWDGGMSEW